MRALLGGAAMALALAFVAPTSATAQTTLNWAQGVGAGNQPVSVFDTTGALVPTGATINSTTHTYTAPGVAAGGVSGQIQFNNAGSLNGTPNLIVSGTTTTLSGTINLPDGGSHTSTLNTFQKPAVFGATASPAGDLYLYGAGGQYGCIYSPAANQMILGVAGAPGAGCSTPNIQWGYNSGQPAVTIFGGPQLRGTTAFFDSGGTNQVAAFAYGASGGQLQFPAASVIEWGNSLYLKEASGGVASLSQSATETPPQATLSLGTVHYFTGWQLTDASNNLIDQCSSTGCEFHNNVLLKASPTNMLFPAAQSFSIIAQGRTGSGQGLNIAGGGGGGLYCDPLSSYCMGREIDFWSGDDGHQVFGMEVGVSDHHALEIGINRDANSMQDVAQLLPLDRVSPPGAIQHFNITNGGTGYTTASAIVTGTGCSRNPSSPADAWLQNGAVVGIGIHYDPGQGCSSVLVNITGNGAGATATATLTAGGTDAKAGMDIAVLHGTGAVTEAAWMGFGQADLGLNRVRFGSVIDSGHPWASSAGFPQPTLAMSGPLEWDTPNAGVENGFTNDWAIFNVAHMMTVQKWDGSAAAGASFGVVRTVPTTVAGLATVDPSPSDGDRGFVTDADACAFNTAVNGGGSTRCPVVRIGGAWVGG